MLSEKTIRIVKATAPAIAACAEVITTRFYSLMFAANPEVQAYFNPAHQHSGGQQRALAGAICAYAAEIDNVDAIQPAIELIAQKHCSLGIEPEHYPIVGRHLLAAVKDVVGDAATEEVMEAWRDAYGFLANAFIKREAQIYAGQSAAVGGWRGYRRFVVERKHPENELVASFYLRPADGGELAAFLPGQYITVRIDSSSAPTSPRNYSLSDRPGIGHYRISVKRETASGSDGPSGVVSNYLHDSVQEGDVLELGPPCGVFTLNPLEVNDRPLALISGGIGITPLMSMLKSLAHHRVQTPVHFVHAARNSRFHALADEAREIAAEFPNIRLHTRYDAPLEDDLAMRRCDSTGFIDVSLLGKFVSPGDTEFYFCGPKPFMAGLLRGLNELKVDASRIHYEFFGPKQAL